MSDTLTLVLSSTHLTLVIWQVPTTVPDLNLELLALEGGSNTTSMWGSRTVRLRVHFKEHQVWALEQPYFCCNAKKIASGSATVSRIKGAAGGNGRDQCPPHLTSRQITASDRFSGHGYTGNDPFSGTKPSEDAILFTNSGITVIVELFWNFMM